ncbi:MAG: SAM-dependent chlorinase/fluorinase [Candidatus Theseobacter exili]|nr:SAM-dependent chlorinase/fluorinase [Candidatus Theseobacter exili]
MFGFRTIVLYSDFGPASRYAGMMKGVIRCIAPEAFIIDGAHDIPKYDIISGAFILGSAWRYFPDGTIHLIVVDPGVGSARRSIIACVDSHFFVAPDNGLLSLPLIHKKCGPIFELKNPEYRLKTVSDTFYGRDVFASAAAYLSCGINPEKFGEKIINPLKLDIFRTEKDGNVVKGRVIMSDSFGNIITNISSDDISKVNPLRMSVTLKGKTIEGLSRCYSDVAEGKMLALIGSSGFLEVSCCKGNAATQLKSKTGDSIKVKVK